MKFNHLQDAEMTLKRLVDYSSTASAVGSGGVLVFSTPSMILLVEQAARDAVSRLLPDGYTTVGMKVDIEHLAATPVGENVTAEARVISVEGRKLIFKIRVFDEHRLIGKGIHHRFVVNLEDFMKKLSRRNRETTESGL